MQRCIQKRGVCESLEFAYLSAASCREFAYVVPAGVQREEHQAGAPDKVHPCNRTNQIVPGVHESPPRTDISYISYRADKMEYFCSIGRLSQVIRTGMLGDGACT